MSLHVLRVYLNHLLHLSITWCNVLDITLSHGCIKVQWMASRFHSCILLWGQDTSGAEQSQDSLCVLSTWLEGASTGLNWAGKPHNHNSALKETGLGPILWEIYGSCAASLRHGPRYVIFCFLCLLFLHQICCTGIVTQEVQKTETKLYGSQLHPQTHTETKQQSLRGWRSVNVSKAGYCSSLQTLLAREEHVTGSSVPSNPHSTQASYEIRWDETLKHTNHPSFTLFSHSPLKLCFFIKSLKI